ncbi:cyclin-J [Eurytemora carolleeae]|uniref:cyclin-J n=1 Tax=Eurytemora carolleeae TaxID=1294199 RepID=UPI000C76B807|nr:cyclin-J [Eurytemora carolleeae]|eukprot:XP_023341055.1 cyclin-J-like [Eurytemora affinis]
MVKSIQLNHPEYIEDIIAWLKKRELLTPEFKRQSPQLSRRRVLVDWTSKVAEKLQLTNCTVHLAVKIVDYFMDGHDIQNPQLFLVCLGSLLLAAKFEEKDTNVPKCSELNAFTKNRFPLSDFISLEIVILKYFKWNLCLPTACYFTEMWTSYACLPTDHHNNGPIVSFREAKAYFYQYVKYFLDLAMQEEVFIDARPSLLASSLLLSARIAFGLTPKWPKSLEEITGYSKIAAEPYTEILIKTFMKDSVEETDVSMEDDGYQSLNTSPVGKVTEFLECSEVMEVIFN